MVDVKRSALMARIGARDTEPELVVRRRIWRMGFRYRLHVRALPGTPDIVLSRLRKVIFVHGCFWHRHPRCRRASLPKTNVAFWRKKLARNAERDAEAVLALREGGWKVLVIWQCETRDLRTLDRKLQRFLSAPP